jgi:hypothetical protein
MFKTNNMKKTLVFALILSSATLLAQDLTSKKGEKILPESGDWSIGIDGSPFLNYTGNLFNGNTSNTTPGVNFLTDNNSIIGKWFKEEKTAYRVGIRLGFGNSKKNGLPEQDNYSGDPPAPLVTDVMKMTYSRIALIAGMEKRKGNTRLQGYYGAEAGISLGSDKTSYTYGNSFSDTNTDPTIWDFGNDEAIASGGSRITEIKSGMGFGLGIRGFIGAEYFVLPKISIGGEFGWGIVLQTQGEGTSTVEYWDGTKAATTELKRGKSSAFGLDVDNNNSVFGPAATLRINLHF